MGFSKLKIPKVCECCGKPFEAKTVTTRFCSHSCATKSGRERKKKKLLLDQMKDKIAEVQARPYISVSEASVLFGISKDTIRRLIKAGRIPAVNFGKRLTRVSRIHLEMMFTAVELPEKSEQNSKLEYKQNECYTIGEVSEKFGVSLSTVNNTIRRFSIPKREVGKYVYVPKEQINKVFLNPKNRNI